MLTLIVLTVWRFAELTLTSMHKISIERVSIPVLMELMLIFTREDALLIAY